MQIHVNYSLRPSWAPELYVEHLAPALFYIGSCAERHEVAHELLGSVSKLAKALEQPPLRGRQLIVTIPDMPPREFYNFELYLHTGQVVEDGKTINQGNLKIVRQLANKLEMTDFMSITESMIINLDDLLASRAAPQNCVVSSVEPSSVCPLVSASTSIHGGTSNNLEGNISDVVSFGQSNSALRTVSRRAPHTFSQDIMASESLNNTANNNQERTPVETRRFSAKRRLETSSSKSQVHNKAKDLENIDRNLATKTIVTAKAKASIPQTSSGQPILITGTGLSFIEVLLWKLLMRGGRGNVVIKAFKYPVDPTAEGMSGYNEIIQRPMDLMKVRHNLECREYTTVEEVFNDIKLTWDNCYLYHGRSADNSMYQQAQRFEVYFLKQYAGMDDWIAI